MYVFRNAYSVYSIFGLSKVIVTTAGGDINISFLEDDKAFVKSIIDYLSGMSDEYIIQIFNELISF